MKVQINWEFKVFLAIYIGFNAYRLSYMVNNHVYMFRTRDLYPHYIEKWCSKVKFFTRKAVMHVRDMFITWDWFSFRMRFKNKDFTGTNYINCTYYEIHGS